MRKNSSEFKTSFVSEAGTFKNNKDYFAYVELDDLACWVAADGIDSDEDSESARTAINSIFTDFMEKPSMSRRRIKKYLNNAHKFLNAESRNVRLKASLIMVVTDYSKIVWAVAGNARMYHFRKGRFNFQSKDQSIAQMMADAGKIGHEEVNSHVERNNLVSYLGQQKGFKPFISRTYRLFEGDVMLLCTAGFWESTSGAEIVNSLKDAREPEELVDTLEEGLLAKQNKVINNYTVAAVYANKVFNEVVKPKSRIVKRIAAVLIPVVMLTGGFFAYRYIKDGKLRIEAAKHDNNGNTFVKDGSFAKAIVEYDGAEQCFKGIFFKTIEDKEKESLVDNKSRITQLIVDGDNQFNSKDFGKALDNYLKARSEGDRIKEYDKEELEEKITKAQNFIKVLNIENEGDKAHERKKYEAALSKYKAAEELAGKVFFYDGSKDLKQKISDTEATITKIKEDAAGEAAAEEQKKKDIKKAREDAQYLEQRGRKKSAAHDFEGAIVNLKEAKKLFEDLQIKYPNLDMKQEIIAYDKLIDHEEEKLNAQNKN